MIMRTLILSAVLLLTACNPFFLLPGGKLEGTETAFATARTIVEELASTVTDGTLRENFRRQAFDLLPRSD